MERSLANITACLSTGKDDWETPDDLFTTYDNLYHFVLDAAANHTNHKCPRYFGPGGESEDALSVKWPLEEGNIWLNPPYSKGLQEKFVRKAICARADLGIDPAGGQVVMLLPSRTDTKLFHEWLVPHCDITFLKGRLKFKGAAQGAPFPSLIAVTK